MYYKYGYFNQKEIFEAARLLWPCPRAHFINARTMEIFRCFPDGLEVKADVCGLTVFV